MKLFVFPLLAIALTGTFGCGGDSESNGSDWQRLPDPPLSARENAVGIWTGKQSLIIGGSDARPCPPTAKCLVPGKPPLRDGAIFDPEGDTWTRIKDAPVGFSSAEGAVMDGRVYIWTLGEHGRPGAPRAFLSYDTAKNRWSRLPLPPVKTYSSIIATDDRIVAFSLSDEGSSWPDFSFDPSTGKWTRLPDDPLPLSFDRTMAWGGSELLLLGKRIGAGLETSKPSLPKAAAFDPDTDRWHRLPRPMTLDQYATNVRWFLADGLLINPAPGEFGGYEGSWDRTYRDGGIFDPEQDEWLNLPEAPDGVEEFATFYGAGITAGIESHYFGYEGWTLDAEDMSWIKIPRLGEPGEVIGGRTVVAAEEAMLVFGGVRFEPGGADHLLNEAWIWSPR